MRNSIVIFILLLMLFSCDDTDKGIIRRWESSYDNSEISILNIMEDKSFIYSGLLNDTLGIHSFCSKGKWELNKDTLEIHSLKENEINCDADNLLYKLSHIHGFDINDEYLRVIPKNRYLYKGEKLIDIKSGLVLKSSE